MNIQECGINFNEDCIIRDNLALYRQDKSEEDTMSMSAGKNIHNTHEKMEKKSRVSLDRDARAASLINRIFDFYRCVLASL